MKRKFIIVYSSAQAVSAFWSGGWQIAREASRKFSPPPYKKDPRCHPKIMIILSTLLNFLCITKKVAKPKKRKNSTNGSILFSTDEINDSFINLPKRF